ncbi:hypothetical protein SAMN04489731_109286 [Amycolatopsis regifaucium]|nr:hypothetical protein SAMN04489731_109286 [Amycolatopsis regifaucium]
MAAPSSSRPGCRRRGARPFAHALDEVAASAGRVFDGVSRGPFDAFLRSMAMDIEITEYATYAICGSTSTARPG